LLRLESKLLFNSILQYWAIVSFKNVAFYIASAVILWSESPRPHDHISLSNFRIHQPGGPGPPIYTSGTWWPSYRPGTGFHPLHSVQSPLLLLCFTTSQSYFTTDGQSANQPWYQATTWDPWPIFFSFFLEIAFRQLRVCYCGAPSLPRGRVCNLQLLLSLASAVFLGSEFRRTHGPFFYSYFRLPQSGGPGSHICFPQEQVNPVIPAAFILGSVQHLFTSCCWFSLCSLDSGHLENTACSILLSLRAYLFPSDRLSSRYQAMDNANLSLCSLLKAARPEGCGKLTSFFALNAIWKKEASLPHSVYCHLLRLWERNLKRGYVSSAISSFVWVGSGFSTVSCHSLSGSWWKKIRLPVLRL
jgi:hypothetical protein